MRAVVQRVVSASVTVDGTMVSKINHGLCVLVGIADGNGKDDSEYVIRKVLNTKLWEGNKRSVLDMGYEVLLVSQFTLCASLKGNKPDFHLAMPPAEARVAYEGFVADTRAAYAADKVQDGVFGAKMVVDISNDGPYTLILDSADYAAQMAEKAAAASVSDTIGELVTDAMRGEWRALPVPPKVKGKPTPEVIATLKEIKAKRHEFIKRLSEELDVSMKKLEIEFKKS